MSKKQINVQQKVSSPPFSVLDSSNQELVDQGYQAEGLDPDKSLPDSAKSFSRIQATNRKDALSSIQPVHDGSRLLTSLASKIRHIDGIVTALK